MRTPLIIFLLLFFSIRGFSQDKDDSVKTSVTKKALNEGIKLITRSSRDSVLVEKSTEQFLPFEGKVIRNIYVQSIGFEKSIYGNEKPLNQKIGRAANKVHTNTRERTIRQHLFIRPNERLNPYKLGDNERFLRERDFILDSRLVVSQVEDTDSVDITVITRDVFAIGMSAGGSFPSAPRLSLYHANLGGRAQRIQVNFLLDQDRSPKSGYGVSFQKSSFLGTFADLELFYTELNEGSSVGEETEFATGIIIDRKLVSPYSRIAGGAQWSRNWSKNVYSRPDSSFLDYSYDLFDLWVGYNLGVNKAFSNRKRTFLALRIFDGYFTKSPETDATRNNRIYNDSRGILGAITLYKRDFFKTQYVFGFGRTEDVPYGYSFTGTAGIVRQLNSQRPYLGIDFDYSKAFNNGGFYSINVDAASYFKSSNFEDAIISSTFSYFTQAWNLGAYKVRNSANIGFARIFYPFASDWLQIDSSIIPDLRVRDFQASSRVNFGTTTTLYTPWSVLGFRVAPFLAINLARMNCSLCENETRDFTGFSGGIRIRNENLIFGTMEIRMTYIPNDESGESKFGFSFRQNLRFRDSDTFVTAPSLIQYN